jgi:aryl-alcohol dehydrogenase-like predicted oxidoreductase
MLAVQEYDALAKQSGITVTQLAMGFQMRREFVGSCIFGATSLAQLKETVGAADTIIGDELMTEIDKIHRRYMNPIQ